MKLTCQLTPADLVAFNEYHAANSPLHKRHRLRYRLSIPIVFLSGVAFFVAVGAYLAAVPLTVFAVVWFVLSPCWLKYRNKRIYQKHIAENVGDSLREPSILELCDDGIHSTSHLGQSVYNYSAVGQIATDGGYTFVYIGKGMALVLPEDRLPRDEIDAFVTEIWARKEAASRE